MRYYPQFMTAIVEYACPPLLRTLRLVSRSVRADVDSRLARHVCHTEEREGTAFLNLQLSPTDTPPRVTHGRGSAKVLDMDQCALADWDTSCSEIEDDERREAAAVHPGEKLLVRYHMLNPIIGWRYVWKPARRSVHFVDLMSFYYGLHARSAVYVRTREAENSTVFHVAYDLSARSNWEFRRFGVQRVHNRGLTLVFSPTNPAAPFSRTSKAYIVFLQLLQRIVENYAETGDAVTLIGVNDWHPAMLPSSAQMGLDVPRTGWSNSMSMQAKIEWWVAYNASRIPDEKWSRGRRDTPHAAVRCRSLPEWEEELGPHVVELVMNPAAVYWGP